MWGMADRHHRLGREHTLDAACDAKKTPLRLVSITSVHCAGFIRITCTRRTDQAVQCLEQAVRQASCWMVM